MKIEMRHAVELRAATEDGKKVLVGYAAKYNSPSQDLGGYREVIKHGAFDRALDEQQDVKALVNHDPNKILGRTSAGTLKLSSDDTGLRFRVVLPNTSYANDVHESVSRGDMSQCSFAFSPAEQGTRWTNTRESKDYADMMGDDCIVRELHDVDLYDVSVVTNPAYEDTEVNAREKMADMELRSLEAQEKELRGEDPAAKAAEAAKARAEADRQRLLRLANQKLKM